MFSLSSTSETGIIPPRGYWLDTVLTHVSSFGRDQTCAMLLALASGNTFLEFREQSISGSITNLAPELSAVAKQAFYDCGERPMWAERMTYGAGTYVP